MDGWIGIDSLIEFSLSTCVCLFVWFFLSGIHPKIKNQMIDAAVCYLVKKKDKKRERERERERENPLLYFRNKKKYIFFRVNNHYIIQNILLLLYCE